MLIGISFFIYWIGVVSWENDVIGFLFVFLLFTFLFLLMEARKVSLGVLVGFGKVIPYLLSSL